MSSPKQGILAPGVVLNFTYEIVELIGVGGTGEVYVANNQATGRQVAIKLLKREFATDPTLVELMQREAHALHEIMHNAVVRYYELLRTDHEGGFSFLVMEYIEGESLSDRIGRGPLPINEVQSIARRIVDGLEAAHRHKVLHRDLTPANIILRKNDPALATMIDFGIAKDQTQTKHSVIGSGFAGTYQYASPEQIDGRQIDARSDFYSLGATLLAACEGKGAGDGKTLEQIIGSKAAVPDLEHIPGEMRPLIQALLQPNPDDRPKTTDEIRVLMDGLGAVDDLDELLGGGAAADERTVIRPAAASNSGTSKDTSKISAPASEKKGSGAVGWVAILLVLVAMGVGAFFIVPDLLEEPLPVASPYEMNLTVAGGTAALRGNAPSEEAVETLRNKIDEALEVGTLNGRLTAAEGAPSANWGDAMVKLIAAAKPLGDFVLTAADTRVALRGMADTPQIYDNVKKTTQEIAAIEALALEFQVALAPQPLAHAAVNAAAAAFSKCGLLSVTGPDPLPPGIPLRLSGPIATESDEDNLRKAMIDLDPNRNVQLDVTVTSELVCKFERLMPGANAPEMGFLFSYGQKGGRLTAADYIAGENPVIDVSIDKSYKDSFLYVFYVDGNTSKVIHLLPYKDRPENVVARAGDESENDYRVRILYPASDVAVGKRGFLVGPPYGTNILVAVASPTAFLEAMLPRNDAAELFLDDLIDALKRAATSD
ncbi:MAG: protein kinase, partial [Pseudomonadota bacterium]